MAFSVADVDDLLRVLRENPEMRAAARREILGEELLALPDLVRQNSLDIQALQGVVAQNSVDIRELKQVVAQNSADTRQNSVDMQRLTSAVESLTLSHKRMEGRLGSVAGFVTERRWRDHFAGRFGGLVNRARLLTSRDLDLLEDAIEEGRITPSAAEAVRSLDMLVEGVIGRGPERRTVTLAVQVSVTVESRDVERALSRAETQRQVGYEVLPVVAGALMDDRLRASAEASGVHVLLHPDDLDVPAGVA